MTLPDPTCAAIPGPPEPLQIRFPGGLTLQGIPRLEGGIITPMASLQALLASAVPAMAGLQPVFLILDAIVKIMAVFGAIPALLTGDIVGFYDALNEAAAAVFALVQLQPALSLPFMLLDIIGLMTAILTAMRDLVTELQALQATGQAMIDGAAGDAKKLATGNCMLTRAQAYGDHIIASLGPMGQMMDIAGQLAGLMPSPPPLPTIGDATGMDLDELAGFLDNLIEVFGAIEIPGA